MALFIVTVKQKKPVVSNALLEDLRTKCPNIQELSFAHINLGDISANKLPRSLTTLKLASCGWSVNWLDDADLPNLQNLALENCTRIDDAELKPVVKFSTLESLMMKGLYRVKDDGIRYLAENLTVLKSLELDEFRITDLAVHHICRNMARLETLKLMACQSLTNSSVKTVCDTLSALKVLDISRNDNMGQDCLKSFLLMKNTGTVICTFDQEKIDENLPENLRWKITRTLTIKPNS